MININETQTLHLGRQGENLAHTLTFDISPWIEELGDGTLVLLNQRSGEPIPYPVDLEREGTTATWFITGADTSIPGRGRCEFRYMVNDVLAKSCVFYTFVAPSMWLNGPPLPPGLDWMQVAIATAEQIRVAQLHAPIVGENRNWYVWSYETSEYVDTGVMAVGYTPQKGTDYYTESEKQEIITAVLDELPNADEVSY